MRLKIVLCLIIIILIGVKHISSPFDLSTGQILQEKYFENYTTNSVANSASNSNSAKLINSSTKINKQNQSKPLFLKKESSESFNKETNQTTKNKNNQTKPIDDSEKTKLNETKENINPSPTQTATQDQIQITKTTEIKTIKNPFVPIMECLDAKEEKCPDRKI
ncbi:MAG: hypothetical protein NZM26_03870 [Patescibacteria group bacterium]|nr:hypothetical protein [Patescibacteria group bacterium]